MKQTGLAVERLSLSSIPPRILRGLFLGALLAGIVVAPASAAPNVSLESSALRIEVNSDPYSYRVIEKSTGEILLSETSAVVLVENELYPVLSASDISTAPGRLEAKLLLQLAGRSPLPAGVPGEMRIRFEFIKPEIIRVSITYPGAKPQSLSDEFADQGEHYYGIWEYPFGGNIDDRGADRDFIGVGNDRYAHHSSIRAPFYVTSRKYGIYVESTAAGHFSVAQAGKTNFTFEDSQLTYDIIYGPSYADVLNRYNALAGPAFMPPTWALGTIWWRDDEHEDLRGVKNAQEKIIQDADRLRSLHIPASAFWLDRPYGTGEGGWGNMDFDSSFPDPDKMIHDLQDRGMYLMLWIANRCANQLYEQGKAKGYLFDMPWPAADVRRPVVYDWFKGELNLYVRRGIRGYKIDRGDEGEMPRSVENINAILFPKLAAEGLHDAYHGDYFEFSRNANDTARKYTAAWSGDAWNSFAGLQMTIKNGLRAGIINFPMWGSDTGGYFAVPSKELFARWFEFSALSPMMEVLQGPKRTVWDDYDAELVAIAQKYTALHHDLIPYTRSYLYQATQTGMPVMRALALAYPEDKSLHDSWDEYLFGRDLLVAPVTVEGATSRSVYLPAGGWMDYNDRKTIYEGGASVTAGGGLGTIPLYVREGGIVVRGDILQSNNNWDAPWEPKLRIEIFPGRRAASELAYYTGSGVQEIAVKPGQDGIEVEVGELGAKGELEVYCRGVRGVQREGAALREGSDYHYDAAHNLLTIPFQGASSFVIEGATGLF
ncbi:MAG: TIM-barrel domain-containing protein [Candidatus Acidiferrales bacterium]